LEQRLKKDLEETPQKFGLPRAAWDGPTLVVHLKERFGVKLKVRQAQNWMHRLGYSLKRASYVYVQARKKDALAFQQELKKTAHPEPTKGTTNNVLEVLFKDAFIKVSHKFNGFWVG